MENQYAEKQDDESRQPEPSAVELPHTIPSDTHKVHANPAIAPAPAAAVQSMIEIPPVITPDTTA